MRQLTFLRPRTLQWRDVPAPALHGGGDALIRPIVSSTCDLDQAIVQGEWAVPGPFAIGHECVAEVLEISDGVTVRPGDIVAVTWHISCGQCAVCRAGRPAFCTTTPPTASFGVPLGGAWGGLHDEVVRVPYANAMLTCLPDGVDPVAAVSAGDNLAVPVELIGSYLAGKPGARILILGRHGAGGGSVGLYGVDVAIALGASEVLYIDSDEHRRAIAETYGALVDPGPPRNALGRFDLIYDCSTAGPALAAAIGLLTPHGAGMVQSPWHFEPITLDMFPMYSRGVTIRTGMGNARTYLEHVLDLLATRRIDPSRVLGRPVPMHDADRTLVEPSLKPLFVREGL